MIFSISLMEIGLSNSNGVNSGNAYFPKNYPFDLDFQIQIL